MAGRWEANHRFTSSLNKSGAPIVIKKLAFGKILTEPDARAHGR